MLICLGFAWACSSSTTGNPPPPPPPTPAIEQLESALCAWYARCSTDETSKPCGEALEGSGEAGAFDSLAALLDSVEAERVEIDSSRIAACLAELKSLPCDGGPPRPGLLPACAVALKGRVAEGDGCIAQEACRPGVSCVSSGVCDGVCTALESGCAKTADCAPGEACASGDCVPVVGAGEEGAPCGSFRRCQAGLVCRDFASGPPTCAQPPKEGDACSLSQGRTCSVGLVCVPDEGFASATCRPVLAKGAPCTLPFECGGLSGPLVCVDGACSERPRSGECLSVGGTRLCDDRVSFCDWTGSTPVCRPFRSEGEPCGSHAECSAPGARAALCLPDASGLTRCALQPELERCQP